MVEYIKIYNQFISFVKEIASEQLSEYEIKLLNLIIENFDDIAKVGTAHGKRAELLSQLITENRDKLSSSLEITHQNTDVNVFPFDKLHSIELEYFRGFSNYEKIEFSKKYTFIFGLNGSGKSSLCEALEFCLLGYINEAINKRIPIDKYIKNDTTDIYSRPSLRASKDKREFEVTPNASLYHFCFIEKNRIENFARISSSTPSEKTNLLSILFGLNDFYDFVNGFTENVENKIDIEGKHTKLLATKSTSIKTHLDNIKDAKEGLKEIEKDKNRLVLKTNVKNNFNELREFILGSPESIGRIKEIDDELKRPLSEKIIVTDFSKSLTNISALRKIICEYLELKDEYTKKRDLVQFNELYRAVKNLQNISLDKCPACETPITSTEKNPFKYAEEKLVELEFISKMEDDLAEAQKSQHEIFQVLKSNVSKFVEYSKKFATEFHIENITISNADLDYNQIEYVIEYIKKVEELKDSFIQINGKIIEFNNKLKDQEKIRNSLIKEKEHLQVIERKMNKIIAQEELINKNIASWQEKIEVFKTENQELIRKVKIEKKIIDSNILYVQAYHSLLTKLKQYKDNLPLRHVARLNDLTKEIYNKINEHDKYFEIISDICLPSKPDESISISFKNEPNRYFDALQILSEGHIRCLGLSILLAKNLSDNLPIIIFDDIVNAIDDDHRGGIRELIFSGNFLANQQIILTTHASMFMRELEQKISKDTYDQQVRKLTFAQDESVRKIRIKSNDIKNYLYNANLNFNQANSKEALYFCRCSLEFIVYSLWKKLEKKSFKTDFSVVIRSPNKKPDLMSVVVCLNKFIKKLDADNTFDKITSVFDYLIGLKTSSNIIWDYLNKGTHEEADLDEFDLGLVKNIIDQLIILDQQLRTRALKASLKMEK